MPQIRPSRSLFRRVAMPIGAALLVSGAGMLAGCIMEGGQPVTRDMHTYVSRPWEPKTVTVIDTRTGEAIWSSDIPVGKKLVIDFEKGKEQEGDLPDKMLWELFDSDRWFGDLRNEVAMPPSTARLIEMKIRPVPEMQSASLPGEQQEPPEEVLVPNDNEMDSSETATDQQDGADN